MRESRISLIIDYDYHILIQHRNTTQSNKNWEGFEVIIFSQYPYMGLDPCGDNCQHGTSPKLKMPTWDQSQAGIS